jgi:hypothetical protein
MSKQYTVAIDQKSIGKRRGDEIRHKKMNQRLTHTNILDILYPHLLFSHLIPERERAPIMIHGAPDFS